MITIASWFIRKNFTDSERYVAEASEKSIIAETEKAYKVRFSGKFEMTKWVPKSCCTVTETPVQTREFKVGDSVSHATFGAGTVLEVLGEVVRASFACGEKMLAAAYLN